MRQKSKPCQGFFFITNLFITININSLIKPPRISGRPKALFSDFNQAPMQMVRNEMKIRMAGKYFMVQK